MVAIGSPLSLPDTVTSGIVSLPAPSGDDRVVGRRVVVHRRGADRRRDQPRQLRWSAGQPAR
ncbi:hypothetical protein G5V59_08560 [Nocardioides sp. W3-2-3]|nr:hypothetical protein [Nocardioides convexus]